MPSGTQVEAGHGRTRVRAELRTIGPDLLVVIGGAGPHIGAATLADGDPESGVAPRTVAPPRHREGELTERVATELAAATGRRTLAVAGIHLDRIERWEIEEIRTNVRALVAPLVAWLNDADPARPGDP